MILLESLLTINKDLPVAVYLQITNGIINNIRRGILKPESALPGSRVLAAALNVHRKTVVAAYDELYAQSWIDVYPRKGIFVAKNLPDITPRPLPETIEKSGMASKTHFYVDDNKIPYPLQFKPANNTHLVFNEGFPD